MCDTPISNYGLIGDMRSCALVDKAGSVDWLCLPRHDSPAVFLRLLDPQGGCCRLEIDGLLAASRRYLENSNILETTFRTATGTLVLRDFMPVRAVEVPDDDARPEGPGHRGTRGPRPPAFPAKAARSSCASSCARPSITPAAPPSSNAVPRTR